MFAAMRSAVGIPKGEDILDFIHALPDEGQKAAFEKIRAIEAQAMTEQKPQPGLVALMEFLERMGVRRAICTRNFDAPVTHFLEIHLPSPLANAMNPIITRDFRPPKPSPAGILSIAHSWGLVASPSIPPTPERLPLLMVGDSIDDMVAGYDAGCLTVLLRSPGKEDVEADRRTDFVVERLDDLILLLENGIAATNQQR